MPIYISHSSKEKTMALYTNSHAHAQEMTYAEVGQLVSSIPRPPPTQTESVEYAILRHDAVVKTLPAEHCKPTGMSVYLHHRLKVLYRLVYHVLFYRSKCRSGPGSDPVAGGGSSLEGLGRSCGHGHRESGENQETCTELDSCQQHIVLPLSLY